MTPGEPTSVLISIPSWLGDCVMAQPALQEIRRTLPNAHIALAARNSVAGLYEDEGLADEIILIRGRPASYFSDLSRLRNRNFDRALLLQNSFASALLIRAARVGGVVGYPTDGRGFLLSERAPF